jgi:hypothetical protein
MPCRYRFSRSRISRNSTTSRAPRRCRGRIELGLRELLDHPEDHERENDEIDDDRG